MVNSSITTGWRIFTLLEFFTRPTWTKISNPECPGTILRSKSEETSWLIYWDILFSTGFLLSLNSRLILVFFLTFCKRDSFKPINTLKKSKASICFLSSVKTPNNRSPKSSTVLKNKWKSSSRVHKKEALNFSLSKDLEWIKEICESKCWEVPLNGALVFKLESFRAQFITLTST